MARRRLLPLALAAALLLALPGDSGRAAPAFAPLGTAFTYQGELDQNGVPLTGACDFQFGLFADPAGGAALGSQSLGNVAVGGGRFTVLLDFGAAAFTGDARFLEIAVRCPAGGGSFTTLSPRQPLTATPYALFARDTGALQGIPVSPTDPTANQVLQFNGSQWAPASLVGGPVAAWLLAGNAGTDPNTQFLGTTDIRLLTLRVNNLIGWRLRPGGAAGDQTPNVLGGFGGNIVGAGVRGATIAGGGQAGQPNSAGGDFATVAGGAANTAGAPGATVGGGNGNTAGTNNATVGGGGNNRATNLFATVGGGFDNEANGANATVGGGEDNRATNENTTVGGGFGNEATKSNATVGGGFNNEASGENSTVAGGLNNRATGIRATVSGGGGDLLAAGNVASGSTATVGGGGSNEASGEVATVGGGSVNKASGDNATVGGGASNEATELRATVSGGGSNEASGQNATVGGGFNNEASGNNSTVGGGFNNTASNITATVPGGDLNSAVGERSFAAGRRAKANHQGAFVWADSTDADFTSAVIAPGDGTNSFHARVSGGARFVDAGGTGVQLPAGGNAWAAVSDRAAKENVVAVDGRAVLEALARVSIATWNLVSQDPAIRHIGPMAQDFFAAFGVGEDDTHISTVDADGVAFAAIKGLYLVVREKEAEIAAQQTRIAELEHKVSTMESQAERQEALEARLAALEAKLAGAAR